MTPQEIQEARLRIGSFNEFDGGLVADSLNAHRDLWCGYVFTRSPGDLLELRDIADGDLNADTLFLIPAPDKNAELEKPRASLARPGDCLAGQGMGEPPVGNERGHTRFTRVVGLRPKRARC